jgi:hypothetical protein
LEVSSVLVFFLSSLLIFLTCSLLSVVDSSHYGDAQSRPRVIILASRRSNDLPELPARTHGEGKLNFRTVKDALGDLEGVNPTTGSGLVVLANRTILRDHTFHPRCSESTQLDSHKTAPTIRTTNGVEHYSVPRSLTVREFARLQSFPDYFEFYGTHAQARKQIGNAVPAGLATALAKCFLKSCYDFDYSMDDDNPSSATALPELASTYGGNPHSSRLEDLVPPNDYNNAVAPNQRRVTLE